MKILVFGDIMGQIGRKAVKEILPQLRDEHDPDIVIANAENLAHGKGITPKVLQEMLDAGIDFFTSGNHVWNKKEAFDCFNDPELSDKIIRPANYPDGLPGNGSKMLTVGTKNVLVINLLGRVFMRDMVDDPFRTFDKILKEQVSLKPSAVLVDFHAEATSEKNAFAWHVQEKATAVWGSHTHVMTADNRVLPDGPAYITDIGMCGYNNGVIGTSKESALPHYLKAMPIRTEIPERGEALMNAIIIEIDSKGQAKKIETITKTLNI